jgi:2-dehydro-3-deoxyphosphooctonate aldolase (KDO 8-P synthase)
MSAAVRVDGDVAIGDGRLALIAGPCVFEHPALALEIAGTVAELARSLGMPYVFKASFDKANRTAGTSFRGVGLDATLEGLAQVRREIGVPVLTDIHDVAQATPVAEVADVLQIPAFLCRQTDLLAAAGATGRVVNIKKGQFLAPEDMAFAAAKAGGERVVLTERGTTFGYRDLVVDFRGLTVMRRVAPVVFDATHSVQSPGGAGGVTGGKREYVAPLARAAVAVGVDALFLETHPDPDASPSDGPNMLALRDLPAVLETCLAIREAAPA